MTVLAFLNQKGGTGKATLSLNVAYGLAQSEQRVLLVDVDLQARFVILRKIPGTVLGREMRQLELPLPVLKTEITQRAAFAESMLQT